MTGSLEIRCPRGDTAYKRTMRQEPALGCWVMGHGEQTLLLVILPHPEPPGPGERP